MFYKINQTLTSTITGYLVASVIVSTLLTAAAGYVINDYYDVKIDFINKPKRLVLGMAISRKTGIIFHFALNLLAIIIAIGVSYIYASAVTVTIFLLWLYSNNLKRKVLVGNILIAVITGFSVALPDLIINHNLDQTHLLVYAAFGITLLRELLKDMEDIRGDAQYGCRTLPIVAGLRFANRSTVAYTVLLALITLYISMKRHNENITSEYPPIAGVILGFTLIYFSYKIYRTDTESGFKDLSTYTKMLMLAGITTYAIL